MFKLEATEANISGSGGSMPGSTPARLDPGSAARLLEHWGFLAHPDLPDGPGDAYLLVALREPPSLRHFDPEVVLYWVSTEGRGVHATLDRSTRLPVACDFSWGLIRIVDRIGVSNEYLTFGGSLRAEDVDGTTIAVFESPVPLLRRGGHSQSWDHGADSLGAFFARLLVPIDFGPGFEARAASATPETRYAAFVAETFARYRRSDVLRAQDPELWLLLVGEARRLRETDPSSWAAGGSLLAAAENAGFMRSTG